MLHRHRHVCLGWIFSLSLVTTLCWCSAPHTTLSQGEKHPVWIKTATNNDGNVSRCRVRWRVLAVIINMNLDFMCLRCFERFTSSVWTEVFRWIRSTQTFSQYSKWKFKRSHTDAFFSVLYVSFLSSSDILHHLLYVLVYNKISFPCFKSLSHVSENTMSERWCDF